jgi:hypothetical protein
MKKIKILLLFAFIPFFCSGQENKIDSIKQKSIATLCYYYKNSEVEKPTNLDWVQKDIEIVQNKLNKLIENNDATNKIIEILPNFFNGECNCLTETFDYGYNLKSTEHVIFGGYGGYKISIIYFENYILKIRIIFDIEKEIMEPYLLSKINFPIDCINGQITYEKTFLDNLEKYNFKFGKLFIESYDTNVKRKESINYFADVLSGGTFQKPFYILNGLGNETFNNLRYFILTKDYKSLEEILFSPSPTSRQFAALTLRYMKNKYNYKPNKNANIRINEILANPKIIFSGILSCYINKFEYDKYDVDKNFEEYLISE